MMSDLSKLLTAEDADSTSTHKHYEFHGSFLGEGTYGKVEKAIDNRNEREVAIKRVRIKNMDEKRCRSSNVCIGEVGIHFTTVREIKVMREIRHPNVMGLLDIYVQNGFMNLVMEVMETDLKKVLAQKLILTESHVKCILKQILNGLVELHKWHITHRDLSPANIFVNKAGVCKIADFGLSRQCIVSLEDTLYSHGRKVNWKEQLTSKVVTLWYRSPELLYGAKKYGNFVVYLRHSVDIWSVGCIFAELFLGVPLFCGCNEIEQLSHIFATCGTPSQENWPVAIDLQAFFPFTFKKRRNFKEIFQNQSSEAIDLLDRFLQLDPQQRISEEKALLHPYFSTIPLPCEPSELPLKSLNF
ncbi:putative cell-cycle-associated protein kinase [Cardiosporidium cionae]|uniref:Cyclin-dependent kinase 2 homolog n=1 Tax=Cardiosporidium cionae TaxID=476202 RepID=A0ABQ7JBC8_9APIC|nr:putative cell-cycle-associated protein kinase [Cardiosporidium cionae]|eukprot:KAF8821312.1 putative cell-cycle-associated protein kinase [Cardiosporidium cionae]